MREIITDRKVVDENNNKKQHERRKTICFIDDIFSLLFSSKTNNF